MLFLYLYKMVKDYKINEMVKQLCPLCSKKTLILREIETDIPNFGKAFIYSMECSNCKFYNSDLELEKQKYGVRYSLDVDNERDLNIKVAKSSKAKIKIGRIMTITPGPASQGFITNIEGLLKRAKHSLEQSYEVEDDKSKKKKLKNMLKKLNNVMLGRDKITIVIEDPDGNSAIISKKAVKKKI